MRVFFYLMVLLLFSFCAKDNKRAQKESPVRPGLAQTTPKAGRTGIPEIDTIKLKEEFLPKGYPYEEAGKSDPFVSLIGKEAKVEEKKVIDLSTLELVGLMGGPKGYVALFEGSDGRSYVIREGQEVRGGYVKDISRQEVIVEITMYGEPIEVRYSLKGVK